MLRGWKNILGDKYELVQIQIRNDIRVRGIIGQNPQNLPVPTHLPLKTPTQTINQHQVTKTNDRHFCLMRTKIKHEYSTYFRIYQIVYNLRLILLGRCSGGVSNRRVTWSDSILGGFIFLSARSVCVGFTVGIFSVFRGGLGVEVGDWGCGLCYGTGVAFTYYYNIRAQNFITNNLYIYNLTLS